MFQICFKPAWNISDYFQHHDSMRKLITSAPPRCLQKIPFPVTFIHNDSLLEPFVLLTQDPLAFRVFSA